MAIFPAAILGLHPLDAGIVLLFLMATLAVAFTLSRAIRKESDFYLGGRRLGRTLQFFLNFGNSTDSTGAVQMASTVYQQGAGGIWLGGLQTLFITPFFWFTQPWWRRARLVTMGDLFVDRFNSKAVASAYAIFSIFIALLTMGNGNFYAFKVAQAMIIKPPAAYTEHDRQQIGDYQEYQSLKSQIESGKTQLAQSERFKFLDSLSKRSELLSFISYVKPLPFYCAYSSIVGIYIVLGGLRAAAVTDAVQGILILVMSILLIPMGLHRIGGVHALHRILPEDQFKAAGIPLYEIAAITFGSMIQIIGLLHNMSTAGSATNENTARFGMISGGFTKRLVIIAWMFCGLLALAILHGNRKLADPDNAWGALSRELLVPGLMGLMLSGMLLGHMPQVGVFAVSVAGLATRNLYEPLVKGKSESHYLRVGQAAIVAVLSIAVIFALGASSVVSAYTLLVTFNTFFGAAVMLTLFWRRLTSPAILIGLAIWVLVMGIVPYLLPEIPGFRSSPALLLQTPTQVITDRDSGNTRVVLPLPVYFDRIARINPRDPQSPVEGLGRFNVEDYILHLLYVPVDRFTVEAIRTVRWAFDGLFPFVLLMALSPLTKPQRLEQADRFFAKIRTPIAPTPEQDHREVQHSYAEPHRFDYKKLFPRSSWQFTKWAPADYVGFAGCWIVVGLILLVLRATLTIGS